MELQVRSPQTALSINISAVLRLPSIQNRSNREPVKAAAIKEAADEAEALVANQSQGSLPRIEDAALFGISTPQNDHQLPLFRCLLKSFKVLWGPSGLMILDQRLAQPTRREEPEVRAKQLLNRDRRTQVVFEGNPQNPYVSIQVAGQQAGHLVV